MKDESKSLGTNNNTISSYIIINKVASIASYCKLYNNIINNIRAQAQAPRIASLRESQHARTLILALHWQ